MSMGFGITKNVKGEWETGNVLIERGDGYLEKSSARLQSGAYVASSEAILVSSGYDDVENSANVAIVGRILTFVEDRDNLQVGDVLCTGENGYASKMSEEEIRLYPNKILGEVVEIPTYDIWRDSAHQDSDDDIPYVEINVKNRVWVKIG